MTPAGDVTWSRSCSELGSGLGGECQPHAPPTQSGCPDLCSWWQREALPHGPGQGALRQAEDGNPLALGEQLCGLHTPNLTWSQILLRARGQLLRGADLLALGLRGHLIGQAGVDSMATQRGEVGRSQAPEPPPRDLNQGPPRLASPSTGGVMGLGGAWGEKGGRGSPGDSR